jgi:hypothetical protein
VDGQALSLPSERTVPYQQYPKRTLKSEVRTSTTSHTAITKASRRPSVGNKDWRKMARMSDLGSRGSRGLQIFSTLWLAIKTLFLSVEKKRYSSVPEKSNVLRRYCSRPCDAHLKVNAVIGRKSFCRFPDQEKNIFGASNARNRRRKGLRRALYDESHTQFDA